MLSVGAELELLCPFFQGLDFLLQLYPDFRLSSRTRQALEEGLSRHVRARLSVLVLMSVGLHRSIYCTLPFLAAKETCEAGRDWDDLRIVVSK